MKSSSLKLKQISRVSASLKSAALRRNTKNHVEIVANFKNHMCSLNVFSSFSLELFILRLFSKILLRLFVLGRNYNKSLKSATVD